MFDLNVFRFASGPIVAAALGITAAAGAAAQTPAGNADRPTLHTNQAYIEEVRKRSRLDIEQLPEVFGFVFGSLPDEVTVYPTENYYYFTFIHKGVEYAGNLRLDALDRDDGILHFAYFSSYNRWNRELISKYRRLDRSDGVDVTRIDPLTYRVTFGGKSVVFHLNDLSDVQPPPGLLGEGEEYIGPVFDESGIQFFLLYNREAKLFLYILNDLEPVPDRLVPSSEARGVWIGTRTGFAFFDDRFRDRKILVGVHEGNSVVNNYFDGPFDQLPDNFLNGDQLREALIDETPELESIIDRFGNTDDGSNRVLIAPYIHYSDAFELSMFDDCANAAGDDRVRYYQCFSPAGQEYGPPADDAEAGPDTDDMPMTGSDGDPGYPDDDMPMHDPAADADYPDDDMPMHDPDADADYPDDDMPMHDPDPDAHYPDDDMPMHDPDPDADYPDDDMPMHDPDADADYPDDDMPMHDPDPDADYPDDDMPMHDPDPDADYPDDDMPMHDPDADADYPDDDMPMHDPDPDADYPDDDMPMTGQDEAGDDGAGSPVPEATDGDGAEGRRDGDPAGDSGSDRSRDRPADSD